MSHLCAFHTRVDVKNELRKFCNFSYFLCAVCLSRVRESLFPPKPSCEPRCIMDKKRQHSQACGQGDDVCAICTLVFLAICFVLSATLNHPSRFTIGGVGYGDLSHKDPPPLLLQSVQSLEKTLRSNLAAEADMLNTCLEVNMATLAPAEEAFLSSQDSDLVGSSPPASANHSVGDSEDQGGEDLCPDPQVTNTTDDPPSEELPDAPPDLPSLLVLLCYLVLQQQALARSEL